MAPEARGSRTLIVVVFLETFFEEDVGQGPRVWETINAVANFEVNPAILHEAVLVDELCWDVAQFDADLLISVQGRLKVKVFDVEGDKLGALAWKDAVDEQFDEVEGGALGTDVAGICDVLACDGDESAVGVRFVRAKGANDFGECDLLAAIGRDVIVEDDVESVGASYSFLCGVLGVSANPLAQAS